MPTVQNILESKKAVNNTIDAAATVFEALTQLKNVDLSYLVVKEGDAFSGIFSERDYSRKVILEGRNSKAATVKEVMSTDLPKVRVTDTLEHCMHALLQNKTRYLLAFDAHDAFAGVITIHDLLRQIIADKETSFNQATVKQLLDHDESSLIY